METGNGPIYLCCHRIEVQSADDLGDCNLSYLCHLVSTAVLPTDDLAEYVNAIFH